jgi:hypothetical protein
MRPQLKLFLNHLPHLFYTHAFRWIGRKRGEVSAAIAVISLISDRFSLRRAYRNLGMRTIGVLLFIPALLKMFVQLKMGH